MGEVDADLMCAPGFQLHLQQGGFGAAREDVPQSNGVLAVAFDDCHFLAMLRVSTDGGTRFTAVCGRCAGGDCQVVFFDQAFGERRAQTVPGNRVAGDDHDAGGIFVETVDDAGSRVVVRHFREAVVVVSEQGVDQSAGLRAGAGVDNEVGRFIDDQDILVLEENRQVKGLRVELHLFGRRPVDSNFITGSDIVAFACRCAVAGDATMIDDAGEIAAGVFFERDCQETVETQSGGLFRDDQLINLGHGLLVGYCSESAAGTSLLALLHPR